MFEVAQNYIFTIWISAEHGRETFVATVTKIEMPLVQTDGGAVINTSSPHFATAVPYAHNLRSRGQRT